MRLPCRTGQGLVTSDCTNVNAFESATLCSLSFVMQDSAVYEYNLVSCTFHIQYCEWSGA